MRDKLPSHVIRLIEFYESISPETLDSIEHIYAADARFKDPFNDVRGHDSIRKIFAHMFETTEKPRFVVLHTMAQDHQAWLNWNFFIANKKGEWTIHGATHLQFDSQGCVTQHRDYWDPVEELYSKLPLLGGLMRWLTRRLSASN